MTGKITSRMSPPRYAVELCDEGLCGGRGDEGGGGGGPQLCAGLVGGGHIEHCSEEVGDPRVLLNLDLCERWRGRTHEGTAGWGRAYWCMRGFC